MKYSTVIALLLANSVSTQQIAAVAAATVEMKPEAKDNFNNGMDSALKRAADAVPPSVTVAGTTVKID